MIAYTSAQGKAGSEAPAEDGCQAGVVFSVRFINSFESESVLSLGKIVKTSCYT